MYLTFTIKVKKCFIISERAKNIPQFKDVNACGKRLRVPENVDTDGMFNVITN